MKLYRNTIILAVVLILVGAAYFLISNKINNNKPDPGQQSINILQLDKGKISQLTILSGGKKFIFKRYNNGLLPVYPTDIRIKTYEGEIIAGEMASLSAITVINKKAANLKQYGLDVPITISAKMDDGSVNTIEVGNMTPTRDGYYLKKKGSNEVYIVSLDSGDILSADENTLWNSFIYSVTREQLTGYSINNRDETPFSLKKDSKGFWKLVAPIKAEVNTQKMDDILDSILSLSAYELEDKNPSNLDKYGLKNPTYSMGIETAQGRITVLFGDEKVRNSLIYAKLANSKEVFTIREKFISLIDTAVEEVINPFIFFAKLNEVSKVVTKDNGETVTSEIKTDSSGNSDKDIYLVNGKNANVKDSDGNYPFRKYFTALIGITLDKVAATENPKDKPAISITYYLKKSSSAAKVDYVPRDTDYYYVFKNGKYTGLLVSRDKLNEIKTTYKALIHLF